MALVNASHDQVLMFIDAKVDGLNESIASQICTQIATLNNSLVSSRLETVDELNAVTNLTYNLSRAAIMYANDSHNNLTGKLEMMIGLVELRHNETIMMQLETIRSDFNQTTRELEMTNITVMEMQQQSLNVTEKVKEMATFLNESLLNGESASELRPFTLVQRHTNSICHGFDFKLKTEKHLHHNPGTFASGLHCENKFKFVITKDELFNLILIK